MARRFMLITICLILSGTASQAVAQKQFLNCFGDFGPTLSEQVRQADAIIIISWRSALISNNETEGQTDYVVSKIGRVSKGSIGKGDRITIPWFRSGKRGDRYLLLGTKGAAIQWGDPMRVTDASFKYILQAPSAKATVSKRIAYYMKHLEHPDSIVSSDAHAELANMSFKDIGAFRNHIPREKVRQWVANSGVLSSRVELYGKLLGLSGNSDDAEMMKRKILEPTEEFRLGIDGVMIGYLLLEGEKGLKILEESKLNDNDAQFSETYAAMNAIRFLWTNAPGIISKSRLRKSMRILLDRTELVDLAIADLYRFEDWSIQNRLMKMYDDKEFNLPPVKRAIIRYFLACSRSHDDKKGAVPKVVVKAKQNLETLRRKDPKTVKRTEKYFFGK